MKTFDEIMEHITPEYYEDLAWNATYNLWGFPGDKERAEEYIRKNDENLSQHPELYTAEENFFGWVVEAKMYAMKEWLSTYEQ